MTRLLFQTPSQDDGQTEASRPHAFKHGGTAHLDREHANAPRQLERLLRYIGSGLKRIFRIAKGMRDIVSGNL
ncbi:hypothetical protein WI90_26430 [Burkholderia ubonensis]|uniref:hypothetical protein n=1 Tax=Burkholderia ubonensis TaxID=101571 RepID=UPI00075A9FFB|nr:hypothetical protein [Burkholderia ubonensis]KVD85861.1 hypothetical protein WI90_26430 [Burkholderia ubonensis]